MARHFQSPIVDGMNRPVKVRKGKSVCPTHFRCYPNITDIHFSHLHKLSCHIVTDTHFPHPRHFFALHSTPDTMSYVE